LRHKGIPNREGIDAWRVAQSADLEEASMNEKKVKKPKKQQKKGKGKTGRKA
jgi:hypothetical protein